VHGGDSGFEKEEKSMNKFERVRTRRKIYPEPIRVSLKSEQYHIMHLVVISNINCM
jgi:hypothetical protein